MSALKGKENHYAEQLNREDGSAGAASFVIETVEDFLTAEAMHTHRVMQGRINHTPAEMSFKEGTPMPDRELFKDYSLLEITRFATGTVVEMYKDADPSAWLPMHPNHDRKFYSKNLRCFQCEPQCRICKKACCMFREAIITLEENPGDPGSTQLLGYVRDATPNGGVDESTIVTCTKCKKRVCPDCFGVCPDCLDPMCIECNTIQFTICRRHVGKD